MYLYILLSKGWTKSSKKAPRIYKWGENHWTDSPQEFVSVTRNFNKGEQRHMVYEFMRNGSYHASSLELLRLSWQQRTQIAPGIARGHLYLHGRMQRANHTATFKAYSWLFFYSKDFWFWTFNTSDKQSRERRLIFIVLVSCHWKLFTAENVWKWTWRKKQS